MKIKIYHAACDTDNGTNSMIGTEKQCEDWILDMLGETRATFEAAGGEEYVGATEYSGDGFWGFVHDSDGKDSMDTYNIDYTVIDVADFEQVTA